jgi:hypothetical protein
VTGDLPLQRCGCQRRSAVRLMWLHRRLDAHSLDVLAGARGAGGAEGTEGLSDVADGVGSRHLQNSCYTFYGGKAFLALQVSSPDNHRTWCFRAPQE